MLIITIAMPFLTVSGRNGPAQTAGARARISDSGSGSGVNSPHDSVHRNGGAGGARVGGLANPRGTAPPQASSVTSVVTRGTSYRLALAGDVAASPSQLVKLTELSIVSSLTMRSRSHSAVGPRQRLPAAALVTTKRVTGQDETNKGPGFKPSAYRSRSITPISVPTASSHAPPTYDQRPT